MHYFTQARLQKYLKDLQDFGTGGQGFNFLIHAIGDAGVREALNAIEGSASTKRAPRHKLTHVELVDKAGGTLAQFSSTFVVDYTDGSNAKKLIFYSTDRPRFKKLHVMADPQVSGNFTLPTDPFHATLERLIGPAKESFHDISLF